MTKATKPPAKQLEARHRTAAADLRKLKTRRATVLRLLADSNKALEAMNSAAALQTAVLQQLDAATNGTTTRPRAHFVALLAELRQAGALGGETRTALAKNLRDAEKRLADVDACTEKLQTQLQTLSEELHSDAAKRAEERTAVAGQQPPQQFSDPVGGGTVLRWDHSAATRAYQGRAHTLVPGNRELFLQAREDAVIKAEDQRNARRRARATAA